THGTLADALKNAAEMIIGPQEHFLAIGMGATDDLTTLRGEIEAATRAVEKNGALILVDLMGGSPAKASSHLAFAGTPVICGVNLPMLLEVLVQREDVTLQELTAIAMQAAKEGVINLTWQLTGK
ncbi:MAG TPA: PTS mannose transporter subunit IIC, partial [Ktedonobacteraceae bacterium]|nr:PTS mannose transporter subunit IIC [Ktedonobacteraceae bacterium]